MLNLENRPTKHLVTFRDGTQRMLCTNKGLKDTPEERKLKSEHMRGVPKKREAVEGWSTVWNIVKPLYARGALRVDIIEITGLSKIQVDNAVTKNGKRPEWNRVKPFTIPGEPKAMVRAWQRRKLRKYGISDDEAKSIQFASLMLRDGLIEQDISDWEKLHNLYQKYGRQRDLKLPYSFTKQLRLELFFRARTLAQQQDTSLLTIYNNLGQQVDPAWFDISLAREENFIMRILDNGLVFDQDKLGLFRSDDHGLWHRPQRIGEHGGIIFDSLEEVRRRAENREMVASGRNA